LRSKSAIPLITLLLTLAFCFANVPETLAQPVYGPMSDKLHIVNYADPYKEFAALETGEIDIVDWPLTKTWIDKFAANPDIVLRDYSEIGSFEYDINNQRWPTGNGAPAEYDPETDTYKHWFDPTNEWDVRAWGFRLALAYLTDKDYIRTEILKGYGNMMPTWLTYPQMGWADMNNLTDSSFIYPGADLAIGTADDVFIPSLIYARNVTKAQELLDSAGFTVNPSTGKRIDPKGDWSTTGAPGGDLKPLIFYIRLDDPNRKAAGEKLVADMDAVGIPVDTRIVEKTVCFKSVMIEYNYHIYTGGYNFGADPWEILQGTFHSSQYWAPIGWSGGYQGFCNHDFDHYAGDMVKNGRTYDELVEGTHGATYIANKYVCSIPLWSSAGVHAYRKGWEGVVNHEGYGLTWGTGGVFYWSLSNMHKTGEDTINLGFKSNPESLSVVSAEWVWDWIVLDAIYSTLIKRNPYNLAEDYGDLASNWTTGTWDTDKIYADFTLRTNAKWHDGTPVTPEDVKWGLEFIRDCGPGVAWNYMMAKDIDHVNIKADEPALGDMDVKVYFKTGTYWAVHLAGFLEFPSRKIWMAASQAIGFGYNPVTHTFADRLKVREYHPWEQDVYNNATGGVGSDGIIDLKQDGTGPWIYVGADPLLHEYIDLEANRNFHLSQTEVSSFLADAFHAVGDVNKDGIINISDMTAVARSYGTNSTWTHGIDWDQYNPDADLNEDGKVDITDLGMAGRSYGKVGG